MTRFKSEFFISSIIVVILFSAMITASAAFELHAYAEKDAVEIDGVREDFWDKETINYTSIDDFGADKLLEIRVFIHEEENQTFIYFALEFFDSVHDEKESFALFLSNQSPDGLNTYKDFNDIKVLRFDGVAYDQEITNPGQSSFNPRNDTTGNDVKLGVSKLESENNHSFYEARFPIQTNTTGDINWSIGETYALMVLMGSTYRNETNAPQDPLYSEWKASSIIPISIGVAPGTDPSLQDDDLSDLTEFFDTLAGKIAIFIIVAIVFGIVGVYIFNTRSRIRR